MVPADDVSPPPRRVYLIGFMGAGKSTVGARLARRLGWPFVELDREIEKEAGRSIPEIFRAEDEEGFRDREHRVLRRVGRGDAPCVVACGGGVPLYERNRRILRETGIPIHLEVSPDTVLRRLGEDASRPLLPSGEGREKRLKRLWHQRQDAYNGFERSVSTEGCSPDEVVEKVLARLRELET